VPRPLLRPFQSFVGRCGLHSCNMKRMTSGVLIAAGSQILGRGLLGTSHQSSATMFPLRRPHRACSSPLCTSRPTADCRMPPPWRCPGTSPRPCSRARCLASLVPCAGKWGKGGTPLPSTCSWGSCPPDFPCQLGRVGHGWCGWWNQCSAYPKAFWEFLSLCFVLCVLCYLDWLFMFHIRSHELRRRGKVRPGRVPGSPCPWAHRLRLGSFWSGPPARLTLGTVRITP